MRRLLEEASQHPLQGRRGGFPSRKGKSSRGTFPLVILVLPVQSRHAGDIGDVGM